MKIIRGDSKRKSKIIFFDATSPLSMSNFFTFLSNLSSSVREKYKSNCRSNEHIKNLRESHHLFDYNPSYPCYLVSLFSYIPVPLTLWRRTFWMVPNADVHWKYNLILPYRNFTQKCWHNFRMLSFA